MMQAGLQLKSAPCPQSAKNKSNRPESASIAVQGVFRDVVRKEYNCDRKAVRLLNQKIDQEDHIKVGIPIDLLNATQKSVNADYQGVGARYQSDDKYRLPAIVRYRGVFYVADGHHRIMAAHAQGRKVVQVRLFDLDQRDLTAPLFTDFEGASP